MIPRNAARTVAGRLKAFPAVALVGPRQAGKTTLARSLGGRYFDLEQDADRLRVDLEWPKLVKSRSLVILDEAQAYPEIFPRLRGAIDEERRRNRRFLLLGSVSPSLMTHVSESLAGRLSIVELTPFLWEELPTQTARNRLWLCGGFPDGGVLAPRRFPRWHEDYLTLLAQRDLPSWGYPARPPQTQRLFRMLAAVQGQTWNASQIGQSLGLSYHTANSYLEYLVGAFLIRRLPAYHANIRKRLVRSPKVYWRDSGLLHALLGVTDQRHLLSQPWVGASWEGFVIEQVIATLQQRDRRVEPCHLRTNDRYEIDLILDFGGERWAIEVKLTSAPSAGDMDRLDKTADMIGASRRILVSQTRRVIDAGGRVSCNLPWLLQQLRTSPA